LTYYKLSQRQYLIGTQWGKGKVVDSGEAGELCIEKSVISKPWRKEGEKEEEE
jgi:hypothetical protein